tara:strand:- start:104 stop:367 length:264 start_codon:yes stop_codon:yes gene_type:complete
MTFYIGLTKKINKKMENEELEQVRYDCDMYLRNLKAIKNAEKLIIEFKGKPKEDTCIDAIRHWKRDNEEIKKTLIPYLDKLKMVLTK